LPPSLATLFPPFFNKSLALYAALYYSFFKFFAFFISKALYLAFSTFLACFANYSGVKVFFPPSLATFFVPLFNASLAYFS